MSLLPMTRVGILAKSGLHAAASHLEEIAIWLEHRGIEPVFETHTGALLGSTATRRTLLSKADLATSVNMVLVLGGDGTLLGMGDCIAEAGSDIPILGVNFGSLGFLTEVTLPELYPALEATLSGKVRIESRVMLQSTVRRNGGTFAKHIAVNDAVVTKAAKSRMVDLSVWIDDDFVTRVKADGLIVATPSGITLALSEPTRELALDFLRSAKERGASACFDVNYRERLWSTGEARDGIMPALEIADVVVCSRADADRVLGVNAPDVVDVARRMLADFAPAASVLVITDGAEGSAGISGSETFRQEAIRAEVIDRIGAGDAFMAGLLWGLLRDEGLDRALEFAAAMGALACTVRGDHALFDEEEVRAVARAGTTELVR